MLGKLLVRKVMSEILDLLGHKEIEAQLGHKEIQDQQVQQVTPVLLVQLGHKAMLDQQALKAILVYKAFRET
jgi:hypothetical protein